MQGLIKSIFVLLVIMYVGAIVATTKKGLRTPVVKTSEFYKQYAAVKVDASLCDDLLGVYKITKNTQADLYQLLRKVAAMRQLVPPQSYIFSRNVFTKLEELLIGLNQRTNTIVLQLTADRSFLLIGDQLLRELNEKELEVIITRVMVQLDRCQGRNRVLLALMLLFGALGLGLKLPEVIDIKYVPSFSKKTLMYAYAALSLYFFAWFCRWQELAADKETAELLASPTLVKDVLEKTDAITEDNWSLLAMLRDMFQWEPPLYKRVDELEAMERALK